MSLLIITVVFFVVISLRIKFDLVIHFKSSICHLNVYLIIQFDFCYFRVSFIHSLLLLFIIISNYFMTLLLVVLWFQVAFSFSLTNLLGNIFL